MGSDVVEKESLMFRMEYRVSRMGLALYSTWPRGYVFGYEDVHRKETTYGFVVGLCGEDDRENDRPQKEISLYWVS